MCCVTFVRFYLYSVNFYFPQKIPDSVFNRFYVTLMLYDLWNEIPVFEVSQKYQVSLFEVNCNFSIDRNQFRSTEELYKT